MPALRRREGKELIEDNAEKIQILIEKFFPALPQVEYIQNADKEHILSPLQISQEITSNEIASVLRKLPSGKAPGPNRISNEVLTALSLEILEGLAYAIN
jgi:hypothetical protein